jgi:phage/plasmid primase-like uncharacterized protein
MPTKIMSSKMIGFHVGGQERNATKAGGAKLGSFGFIVLVFGFVTIIVLAILLGALVVAIAVTALALAAAVISRFPKLRRGPR